MGGCVTPVRRVIGLLLAAMVLCAGCKVDARVDVTLRADGSGTVTARVRLDADAVRRLTTRASLDQAVPLDDVRTAGWTVSGWKTSHGATTLTLSHDFVGQTDLARRLSDLVGPTGVLRDARVVLVIVGAALLLLALVVTAASLVATKRRRHASSASSPA
jgi:hypothetical protein